MINREQFNELAQSMTEELTELDIDCAFVFLSRGGGPFAGLKIKKDTYLSNCLIGIDSKVAFKIFNEIEDVSTS